MNRRSSLVVEVSCPQKIMQLVMESRQKRTPTTAAYSSDGTQGWASQKLALPLQLEPATASERAIGGLGGRRGTQQVRQRGREEGTADVEGERAQQVGEFRGHSR